MRYLVQVSVMFGEVLLLVALSLVLFVAFTSTVIAIIPAAIIFLLVLCVFKKAGGFIVWTPSGIKRFVTGTKRTGV